MTTPQEKADDAYNAAAKRARATFGTADYPAAKLAYDAAIRDLDPASRDMLARNAAFAIPAGNAAYEDPDKAG